MQDIGNQYFLFLDDYSWKFPDATVHHANFWACWIPEFNAEAAYYDAVPHPVDTVNVLPLELEAAEGSILNSYDGNFNLQWGLMRGDTLLGYCSGNARACGHGHYYVNEPDFTCQESLIVTLWDNRYPPEGVHLLFGYEIFEDVPWDEYGACN